MLICERLRTRVWRRVCARERVCCNTLRNLSPISSIACAHVCVCGCCCENKSVFDNSATGAYLNKWAPKCLTHEHTPPIYARCGFFAMLGIFWFWCDNTNARKPSHKSSLSLNAKLHFYDYTKSLLLIAIPHRQFKKPKVETAHTHTHAQAKTNSVIRSRQ